MKSGLILLLQNKISCRWRTRATCWFTANVLQTKLDAQHDKLATELSWQRLRRSTFSSCSELSKVANFNVPQLHWRLRLEWLRLNCAKIFGVRKLRSLGYRVALFAWCTEQVGYLTVAWRHIVAICNYSWIVILHEWGLKFRLQFCIYQRFPQCQLLVVEENAKYHLVTL